MAGFLCLLGAATAEAQETTAVVPPASGASNQAAVLYYSRQTLIGLDPGETQIFRLKNGTARSLRLESVREIRDSVIKLVRRAEVRVAIDGQPLDLICQPYVMPTEARGLRIQADTTSAWRELPKRVQFSLWDATDPIVDTNRFGFPLRDYQLFSHGTQAYGEPVYLGDGDGDPAGQRFYHDYGFDLAGYEGREEVVSVAAGTVVKFWPSREDPCSILIQDRQGLIWEHAHLKTLAPGLALGSRVALGQPIGLLGRTGPSGNFSHLHVGTFLTQQDLEHDRANRRLNLYPWMVAAYQAQHPTGLHAVARPHQTALAGETLMFDGANSLVWGGRRIVEQRWVFPDGPVIRTVRAEKVFAIAGTYVVALWVRDDQGAQDVDFCQVKVFSRANPEPAMPHIFMTHTPATEVRCNQSVTFRCWLQGKGEPRLQIDFGDGTQISDCQSYAEVRHSFKTPGIHIVTAHCAEGDLPVQAKQKVVVRPALIPSRP